MSEHRTGAKDGAAERRRDPGRSAPERIRTACAQFAELTGLEPESVSAMTRTEDGWELRIEVVELERVPETMSLLASYAVTVGDEGDVLAYERRRRYTRGRADPGDSR
ncbi:MAG: gas vesicle protein [Streptosporangiales bacterium]|nr:gas vesicle protein [Streptosporangiales bacterium]